MQINMRTDKFFTEFLEAADQLGGNAQSELSHSEGVDTKELFDDAVKHYSKLLDRVNKKFNKFKSTPPNE